MGAVYVSCSDGPGGGSGGPGGGSTASSTTASCPCKEGLGRFGKVNISEQGVQPWDPQTFLNLPKVTL